MSDLTNMIRIDIGARRLSDTCFYGDVYRVMCVVMAVIVDIVHW